VYAARAGRPFEIYARAQSSTYFDTLKCVFNVSQKTEFEPLFKAFAEQQLRVPQWQFESFNPVVRMGYDQMATRP
jgi:hypothetical protein